MVVCHPLLEAEFWGIALIEIAHVFQYILQHRYRNSWNKNTYLLTKEGSRNMYNKMIISFSLLGYIWTGYCLNVSEAPNTTCFVALQDMSLGGYIQYSLMILQRFQKNTGQELRINHEWNINLQKHVSNIPNWILIHHTYSYFIVLSTGSQQEHFRRFTVSSPSLRPGSLGILAATLAQRWAQQQHDLKFLVCINPYCLWLEQTGNMNMIEMKIHVDDTPVFDLFVHTPQVSTNWTVLLSSRAPDPQCFWRTQTSQQSHEVPIL